MLVTSSAASVSDFSVYKVLDDDDWNEPSIREIEEKGASAPGHVKYFASKTTAEKGKPISHAIQEITCQNYISYQLHGISTRRTRLWFHGTSQSSTHLT